MSAVDLMALGLLALQAGFVFMMVVYLISGLDDLFFDLLFFASKAGQWFSGNPRHRLPSLEEMAEKPEQPFALMFPAWQEAAVIRRALLNTISNIDYRNFHVFVGTYINDPETQREVEEVMREHANVTQLIVPHPGPTCKADCLNWIVRGIRDYQAQHGIHFAGVILHDAEDVVDTLSLKLFNCLMPEWDLVQIPIISLERRWWDLIGGHYMDEFAEAHCKELHVREWFAGIVPGAGVGTGYSMRALDAAAATADGNSFSTGSLTEDYEFSFRIHQSGLKQTFVRYPIERRVPRRSLLHRRPRLVSQRDFITTREFFPHLFWASVRQKTRWVIGISLQGWKKFAWHGDWRVRYLYFRDRKTLFTQQLMVLGYIVALGLLGVQISSSLFPDRYIFAPPFDDDSRALGSLLHQCRVIREPARPSSLLDMPGLRVVAAPAGLTPVSHGKCRKLFRCDSRDLALFKIFEDKRADRLGQDRAQLPGGRTSRCLPAQAWRYPDRAGPCHNGAARSGPGCTGDNWAAVGRGDCRYRRA